jgi:hypothetical protein
VCCVGVCVCVACGVVWCVMSCEGMVCSVWCVCDRVSGVCCCAVCCFYLVSFWSHPI